MIYGKAKAKVKNKEEIENIFKTSNSHEELFDAFTEAITNKYNDVELYKILLANPALGANEVIMFSEKIGKEFPSERYDLYFWVAELFSGQSFNVECYEKALEYYLKVFEMDMDNYEPLSAALGLYNYDLNITLNKEIVSTVEKGADIVKDRSKIYYALAEHYNKTGDSINYEKYSDLANKAAKNDE